eukprot:gene32392-biopygen20904
MIILARFAGLILLILARLVGLAVALILLFARRLRVAGHERLRLHRHEARFSTKIRECLAVILTIFRSHLVLGARLRLILAKLFLGSRDQAKIMFGVLIVVFGRDRIARGACVARELDVFFSDM